MKVTILALLLTLLPLSATTAVEARTGEQACLSRNIYYEAGHASTVDKIAVGYVTINRLKVRKYPTVCSVIYAKSQFSWTTSKTRVPVEYDSKAWSQSSKIAENILNGSEQIDPTGGATYFHNKTVSPVWARKMRVTLKTTHHVYLKV